MIKVDNLELLEPKKLYEGKLKDGFDQNVKEFFDDLSKKANTDVAANRETCDKYYKIMNDIKESNKIRKKKKGLKAFLIVLAILCLVAAAVGGFFIYKYATLGTPEGASSKPADFLVIGLALAIGGIGLAVLWFILIGKKLNPAIKNLDALIAKMQAEANQLKSTAYAQMATLNGSLDYNMPVKLLRETIPLFELDDTFDPLKYQYMHEKYGLGEILRDNESTLNVQSGSILGNPFLLQENYVQDWRDHTYYGSLTITYTEYYTDSNGNLCSRKVTQTLKASYTAPEPCYYHDTWLVYGNDAAPNLNFSRKPSNANKWNEKDIKKVVTKADKELDKISEKAIKKGGRPFMRLQNTEFEALFHSWDRDNDVEYRLLFTPLAQKSMVDLITSKVPFGDDFEFVKRGNINLIQTQHSQKAGLYDFIPEDYMHFDFEVSKNRFVNACNEFCKNLFFEFAPLFTIPLYTQTKTKEYIYESQYRGNITSYEVESVANKCNGDAFKHKRAVTNQILKAEFLGKHGDLQDTWNIRSYSYEGIDRIEYIPVLAGDGNYYNVPVPWIEYLQVEAVTPLTVAKANASYPEYKSVAKEAGIQDGVVYHKRFMATLANNGQVFANSLLEKLNSK